MTFKRIMAVGIPAAAVLVTVASMGIAIWHRGRTISELRAALAATDIPETTEPAQTTEPFYEPAPVNHHYDLAGKKLYIRNDTFGQTWMPMLEEVPQTTHPLLQMKQQEDGRMLSWDENGRCNAMTGIDISAHNYVTDWDAVKADGIDFVMLRVGYRGYETGHIMGDEDFYNNYLNAKAAGLKIGAYFFSQACTEDEAIEEALYCVRVLDGLELDFPVAFDWEIIFDNKNARTSKMSVNVLTDCCLAFCQNVEAYGYKPMIYQSKRTALFKLDLPRLQGIPFWLAEYGDGPTYAYDYDMWQYSCTAEVAGIRGDVDLNLSFYDFSQEGYPKVSTKMPEGADMSPPDTAYDDTLDYLEGIEPPPILPYETDEPDEDEAGETTAPPEETLPQDETQTQELSPDETTLPAETTETTPAPIE